MNEYSQITSALASELLANLASTYSGLITSRQLFKPDTIPATFTRYGIIVSPNSRPWDEMREANRSIFYVFRVDLFCLVRNYDDTSSLFGTSSPDLGLFELVNDVKGYLRTATLGGLLSKTYDEPGGDPRRNGGGGVEFGELATGGLSSGSFSMVQRAKIPYLCHGQIFCHSK